MANQGGKGNSKQNFRKARTHAAKRKRYRAKMYAISTSYGMDKERLGRKLRRLHNEKRITP
jgi:hypothetical protein